MMGRSTLEVKDALCFGTSYAVVVGTFLAVFWVLDRDLSSRSALVMNGGAAFIAAFVTSGYRYYLTEMEGDDGDGHP